MLAIRVVWAWLDSKAIFLAFVGGWLLVVGGQLVLESATLRKGDALSSVALNERFLRATRKTDLSWKGLALDG